VILASAKQRAVFLDRLKDSMSAEPLSCPFCNAYVSLQPGTLEPGQRLLCSRCGESFTYRGDRREVGLASEEKPAFSELPSPRQSWSNRKVALAIVGGMAIMAVLGLCLSLATQGVRRAHDMGLPKDRTLPLYLAVFVGIWIIGLAFVAVRELRIRYERTAGTAKLPLGYVLATITFLAIGGVAVTMLAAQISRQRASRPALENTGLTHVQAVAPASLAGLGYLPADCDLIAGVHMAEAEADPLAKEFFEHLQPGGSELSLSSVQKWTGLSLAEMDHVVLGLRVQGNLTPRLTLVVTTNKAYDPEKIRQQLKTSPAPVPGKKETYKFTPEHSVFSPSLWFAGPRTLVLGLSGKDLEAVPAQPRSGLESPDPELRGILTQRMVPGTPLWMVGRPRQWNQTLTWGILAGPLQKQGQPVESLTKVRMFGVWFQFGNSLVLNAAVQGEDAASAKTLESDLTGREVDGKKGFRLAAPSPKWETLYQELGQNLKSYRNESWVVLQARASAETVKKAIQP
jgi:hypothetical protein